MNKLNLLIELLESFLFDMIGVLSVRTEISKSDSEYGTEYILTLYYSLIYKGKIDKDCVNYTFYENDLECEFAHVLSQGLYTISDIVAVEQALFYIEQLQEREVI